MPRQPSLHTILRPFFPLFLIAAALPLLIFGVLQKDAFSLFSRADSANTLRIWMEPTTIISNQGKPVTITVMAALDKKETLLPSLSLNFATSSQQTTINPDTLTYTRPFGGQIVVGQVTITPKNIGKEIITIPKESIHTGANVPLDVVTEGITIITE